MRSNVWLPIVHRTREKFPRLVDVFVCGLWDGSFRQLAGDLHHPTWGPDGMPVLFVLPDPWTSLQWLLEANLETGRTHKAFDAEHVQSGNPSYDPLKPRYSMTDCYGGRTGNGLALINLKDWAMTQLVTIPLGPNPEHPADDRSPIRTWGNGSRHDGTSMSQDRSVTTTPRITSTPERQAAG